MIRQTSRDRLVYDRIWRSEGIGAPSEIAVKMISELVNRPDEPRPRIADLGCGAGRHALYAAERGLRVTAVDHSETALEVLRSAIREMACDVVLGDAYDWIAAQPQSSLDGVICFDSLHHTGSDPVEANQTIRRIADHIRYGGLLLITLLCDIAYSTGERAPDRLLLSLDEGAALLNGSLFEHTVLTEEHTSVRIPSTISQDPTTGEFVEASYAAERLLRLYRIDETKR